MALNTITPLTEYTFKIASIDELVLRQTSKVSPKAVTITFEYVPKNVSLAEQNYEFIQTVELTEAGIAVQPYGAVLINMIAPSQLSGLKTAGGPIVADTHLNLKTAGGLLVADTGLTDILDGGVGTTVTFGAKSEGGGGESAGT